MSEQRLAVTCPRCGHTWSIDLAKLDQEDQVIYKGRVQQKSYRVQCPRCDTYVVVKVAFEEAEDG